MSSITLTTEREAEWVDIGMRAAPKWSLTGDHARATFGVKTGRTTLSSVEALRFAVVYADQFRPADTFERFLDVNGIEIVD